MLKRSASRGVSHLRLRFFFVGKFRLIDLGISGEEREGGWKEDVWKDGGLIVWDAVWRKVCLVEMRWKVGWMDKWGCWSYNVSRRWWGDAFEFQIIIWNVVCRDYCYFIIIFIIIFNFTRIDFQFLKYFSSFRSQSFRFFPLLLLFSNSSRNWV